MLELEARCVVAELEHVRVGESYYTGAALKESWARADAWPVSRMLQHVQAGLVAVARHEAGKLGASRLVSRYSELLAGASAALLAKVEAPLREALCLAESRYAAETGPQPDEAKARPGLCGARSSRHRLHSVAAVRARKSSLSFKPRGRRSGGP